MGIGKAAFDIDLAADDLGGWHLTDLFVQPAEDHCAVGTGCRNALLTGGKDAHRIDRCQCAAPIGRVTHRLHHVGNFGIEHNAAQFVCHGSPFGAEVGDEDILRAA